MERHSFEFIFPCEIFISLKYELNACLSSDPFLAYLGPYHSDHDRSRIYFTIPINIETIWNTEIGHQELFVNYFPLIFRKRLCLCIRYLDEYYMMINSSFTIFRVVLEVLGCDFKSITGNWQHYKLFSKRKKTRAEHQTEN